MWTSQPSEKEQIVELINPQGMMVGYVFEDSINDLLHQLNTDINQTYSDINKHDAGGEA